MTTTLKQTALGAWHESHGARIVDFAGWAMPVQYRGIVAEHLATRNHVALFDVSHMGRLDFSGSDCSAFLDGLSTRRIANTQIGRIRYSLMCKEDGGILDDVLIYRLANEAGDEQFSMVVNASNREKIVAWLQQQQLASGGDCSFVDRTMDTAMIAVQGPQGIELAKRVLGWDPSDLAYYSGRIVSHEGTPLTVSRTGYTGEDGVELIADNSIAAGLWERLMELGADLGVEPAGLGARDTLRLEAAMPLYGHELGEDINAAQTGLGFAIQMKDRDFVGKSAIQQARAAGDLPVRVGLELEGKRPAREGAQVLQDERAVGQLTSGTYSPTLQTPIGMAYVHPGVASEGTALEVDIRGSRHAAKVVPLPFYSRQQS